MDIIIHTLSGIAIGTVVAAKMKSNKAIFIGGIGGAFPDIDVISLWADFDSKLGSKIMLGQSGHDIYFGKYWYSHHAIMHSVFAALLFAVFIYLFSMIFKSKHSKSYAITAFLAFVLHLFEDMPTPGSVWGGVNLFWPTTQYFGGTGDIWWWNNYDLFLIVLAIVCINTTLIAIANFKNKSQIFKMPFYVFLFGLSLGIYQIKTRKYDFDYKGFSTNFQIKEAMSLDIQKNILGDRIFNLMVKIDNTIPLNF